MAGNLDSGDRTTGRLLPLNRLEAFSDGVFAIVITLLVLELAVPEEATDLWRALTDEWPAYLGYFVSFSFIGGAWIAHSNMTRFIRAADAALMRLNLLLLLFVSFLPFTTSLMATHLTDKEGALAVVLFGINLTLAAAMVIVVGGYVGRTGLAADDVAEEELRAFERERRIALALQAAATALALVLPVAAVVVFLAISVLLLVDPLWRARRRRRVADRQH